MSTIGTILINCKWILQQYYSLPVPQWALGNDGCMVRALPALTALYLPESAAVQLTADCGLAGVKRVQCTGNVVSLVKHDYPLYYSDIN